MTFSYTSATIHTFGFMKSKQYISLLLQSFSQVLQRRYLILKRCPTLYSQADRVMLTSLVRASMCSLADNQPTSRRLVFPVRWHCSLGSTVCQRLGRWCKVGTSRAWAPGELKRSLVSVSGRHSTFLLGDLTAAGPTISPAICQEVVMWRCSQASTFKHFLGCSRTVCTCVRACGQEQGVTYF